MEIPENMENLVPISPHLPRVNEYYKGKTIFMTGVTGFLGQAFIEKMLWICPEVKKIYVLMRGKKNYTAQERLEKLFQSHTFERLRNRGDNIKDKIIPITGDIMVQDLGISSQDRDTIISEVNIILHVAANIKFTEPITEAFDSNVLGTKYMLDLACSIPSTQLEVFHHVSTAYVNCNMIESQEKLYEQHVDWSDALKIRSKIDPVVFNTLEPKVLDNMVNTYIMTKNIAEHMVHSYGDRIPIVISRPVIVTAAMSDPVPGWFINFFGSQAVLLGYVTGVLRVDMASPNAKPDFMTVDLTINAIIFTTYLRRFQLKDLTPFYNISATEHNLTKAILYQHTDRIRREKPMKYSLWKPNVVITTNAFVFYVCFMLYHLIPAILVDTVLLAMGKKPKLFNVQIQVYRFMHVTKYFFLRSFEFDNKQMHFVHKFMHEDDKTKLNLRFSFTKEELAPRYYDFMVATEIYLIRKFLKQTPEEDKYAERLRNVLDILDATVKVAFYLYIAWFIYSRNLIMGTITATYNFIVNF